MSNHQQRAAHLLDRRVILAVRNAGKIAARNPDAVVLGLMDQTIWQGRDCWKVSSTGLRATWHSPRRPHQMFRFLVLMISSHGKLITREVFHHCLWGDDPNGGPDVPDGVYYVLRSRSGALFDWLGLTVENRGSLGWMPMLAKRQSFAQAA